MPMISGTVGPPTPKSAPKRAPALGVVPVFVNNFNRLTSTRALVEYLDRVPHVDVTIVDNGSTYEPLLAWYLNSKRHVELLGKNLGHLAPWTSGLVGRGISPYYAVTDSDLDLAGCPPDVLRVLHEALERYPTRFKAGLGLRLDDLPDTALAAAVHAEEDRWWRKTLDEKGRFYAAYVDTTFALYRRATNVHGGRETSFSVRTGKPYVARHLPWYLTAETATDEDRYYAASCRRSESRWARGIAAQLAR